jgi:peptidoglycan/LPS O-acetylase OafA/YrhL
MPNSRARIPSLDGLRALSIVMVLILHLGDTANFFTFKQIEPFNFGFTGVRVFFVISGFLITSLLLEEHDMTGRISLKHFYLRRMLRIFPCSYAFITIAGVLSLFRIVELAPHDLVRSYSYTVNYGHMARSWTVAHLWSLSVEEQFYLLWPAVVYFGGRRVAGKTALCALALCPVIRLALWVFAPQWRADNGYTFETVADALATGCVLACYRDFLWSCNLYRRLLTSRWVLLVPFIAIGGGMLFTRPRLFCLFGQTVLNVAVAVCIDWTIRFPKTTFGRFLNASPVVFIGILSYSLYIWQQFFCVEFRHHGRWWSSFPTNALLSFAVAIASYYLIEKPFLRLRWRIVEPSRAESVRHVSASGGDEPQESGSLLRGHS